MRRHCLKIMMHWWRKLLSNNKRDFIMKRTLVYIFVISLLGVNFAWAQAPAATAKPEEISMEALLAANNSNTAGKNSVNGQKATRGRRSGVRRGNNKNSRPDVAESKNALPAGAEGTPQPVAMSDNKVTSPTVASSQTAVSPVEKAVVAASESAQPAVAEEEQALQEAPAKPDFVAPRETVPEQPVVEKKPKVVYNPQNHRDPTLSPDDFLLLQYREQQRLAAIEAERQRKLEEERRAKEEAERQRLLELARIKDPTREVRNKIKVGGIIGQEVFIGSKIYTVGKSIYGARIVEVRPEEVVFSYKGHKFVRKVQLN